MLIGGEFTEVNDVPIRGLARLEADGALDATFSGLGGGDGVVEVILAAEAGRVVVGGRFSNLPDLGVAELLRLEADGQVLDSLRTMGDDGLPGAVLALGQAADGGLIFSGKFSAVSVARAGAERRWLARPGLARLSPGWQSLDLAFDPGSGPEGFGSDDVIRCLSVEPTGDLLIGGGFRRFAGLERQGIARLIGTNASASTADRPPRWLSFGSTESMWEGATWTFAPRFVDPDTPTNQLRFDFEGPVPPGLQVDPVTGGVRWTPTEAQGPSTNTMVLRVTDNSYPPLSASLRRELRVLESNSPPVFASVSTPRIRPGQTLHFPLRVSDPDIPATPLSLWLGRAVPAGVRWDVAGSALEWEVPADWAPGPVSIEVIASDGTLTGVTSLGVVVVVESGFEFALTESWNSSSQTFHLQWPTAPGTNYRVQYRDELAAGDWRDLDHPIAVANGLASVDLETREATTRFFRVMAVSGN